jgi:hypothetical protein
VVFSSVDEFCLLGSPWEPQIPAGAILVVPTRTADAPSARRSPGSTRFRADLGDLFACLPVSTPVTKPVVLSMGYAHMCQRSQRRR